MRRLFALVLVGSTAVGSGLEAQERPVPAVLSYPANVRSAGLAGAGAAMIGYAGSVFNNPSGLAPIRSLSVEAAVAHLPDGPTYTMGAAAVRVGSFNVGGGYQYLRFPKGGPVYDNLSWTGALVYRWSGLSFGSAAQYVSVEDSSGAISRAITSDLSTTVAFFDIAALALSVQNVGDVTISNPGLRLPRTVHLGFSLNLLDTYSNGRLLATIETVWRQGEERRTVVGVEAGAVFYGLGVVARVGTGGEPGTPVTPFSTTTYGGSIVAGKARLDYAYQKQSALGRGVHLFGIRWTP
jgi:hypothetical protein